MISERKKKASGGILDILQNMRKTDCEKEENDYRIDGES